MKNKETLTTKSNHLSQRISFKLLKIIIITFLIGQVFNFGFSAIAAEKEPKYWSEVRQKNSIGYISAANKALRGRVITFEPGAVAKFHVHKAPGIRYVLEGAITVKGKDGKSDRYPA